ncbi:MAG: hypothetical protein ACXW0F_10730 [Gaiellaceae bacterium]
MIEPDAATLGETLAALERWGTKRQWLGADPYEGLNARRVPVVRRSAFGRRVLVQLVKRSPVDLRRPLGIAPEYNAVGVANVVSAYARATFLPEPERREKLERMLAILRRLRLEGFSRPCWGYHFDVETRVFFYPRTRPNTIATAFAGQALLDAFDATGDSELLAEAKAVGDFFLEKIGMTETEDEGYFGYFIGDRTPIHNANMLVCALLARLLRHGAAEEVRRACLASLGYCVRRQREDGSWPYGEVRGLEWVDGFHTGYVLDALLECEHADVDRSATEALDRGLAFYAHRLFLPDGTPKYYADATYPIDAQCVAQAIQTFALAASTGRSYSDDAWRVFAYAHRHMRRDDGAFVFQRRRHWRNATPHIRWVQAPMFLALAHLRALAVQAA